MAAFGDASNLFGTGLPSDRNVFAQGNLGPHPSNNYTGSYNPHSLGPRQVTQQPMTTGTSVLAVKYDGGVMIGADTLGSYGNTARYRDIRRIFKVNDRVVVGAGGDVADMQYIEELLEDLVIEGEGMDDGHEYSPLAIHSYLTRVMYNRRSNMNPLWNTLVVVGVDSSGKSFVGSVDLVGVAYENDTISTGYGAYIAQPLLRNALEKKQGVPLTKEEARKEIETALQVLHYRDCRSLANVQICSVDKDGVDIPEPFVVGTKWGIANMVVGYE